VGVVKSHTPVTSDAVELNNALARFQSPLVRARLLVALSKAYMEYPIKEAREVIELADLGELWMWRDFDNGRYCIGLSLPADWQAWRDEEDGDTLVRILADRVEFLNPFTKEVIHTIKHSPPPVA
jgi:hypothetical protein